MLPSVLCRLQGLYSYLGGSLGVTTYQVACETEQPQIHLSLPASTTVGELKDLSVDRFREACDEPGTHVHTLALQQLHYYTAVVSIQSSLRTYMIARVREFSDIHRWPISMGDQFVYAGLARLLVRT